MVRRGSRRHLQLTSDRPPRHRLCLTRHRTPPPPPPLPAPPPHTAPRTGPHRGSTATSPPHQPCDHLYMSRIVGQVMSTKTGHFALPRTRASSKTCCSECPIRSAGRTR